MKEKDSSQIIGLYQYGDEESNAAMVTSSDLIWGIYGIGHIVDKVAESGDLDVLMGIGAAARAISSALVDRISVETYIAKPSRPRRPPRSKLAEPFQNFTPEQRARYEALARQLSELNMEVLKNPEKQGGQS
jgi:hypothetical protein